MSLVIVMYVREGIVMASDSRLTLDTTREQDDKRLVRMNVSLSDASYKTFLAPNNVGISTFGAADIKGVPIAGYIESFIHEQLADGRAEVDTVPAKLVAYFDKFEPPPATQFFVAGYKAINGQQQQHIWQVTVQKDEARQLNPPGCYGANWGGDADILSRLVQPLAEVDKEGQVRGMLPFFQIPYQFFTLQDAIDFCVFAVRSTIDAIRFQPRPKTVGGPIDVLVIKPGEAFWVQRKQLLVR